MELSFCNFTPLGIPVRCHYSPDLIHKLILLAHQRQREGGVS